MKHLFIPYEIAVIAKEKGFNDPCLGFYYRTFLNYLDTKKEIYKNQENIIDSPLYQQIIDWFREKHNIQILEQVLCFSDNGIPKYKIKEAGKYKGADSFNLNKAIEEAFKLI